MDPAKADEEIHVQGQNRAGSSDNQNGGMLCLICDFMPLALNISHPAKTMQQWYVVSLEMTMNKFRF